MPLGPAAPLPGTWRNVERSGERHVTRLSSVARRVENVRHYDCDLYQVCARCRYPQLFAEVKSRDAHEKEWLQTRLLADRFGCFALLVIEIPGKEQTGIRIYHANSRQIQPLRWGNEEFLMAALEAARDLHACK